MCVFLGSRFTKHEIHEAKKELSKKRKHYDDYDVYVYYKNLLELEKKKKNKKRKIVEDEFEPCNYISSIYKSKKIKKKTIYDYIDKDDNIYEDIVTNENFGEEKNYSDDINFTFFNESLSYALLRNNNYIDGIPIGVNVKEKNNFMKSIYTNDDNKNALCHFPSPSISYSSSCTASSSSYLKYEEKFTNDLNLEDKGINKKYENEINEKKEEFNKIKDKSKNKYFIKKKKKNTTKEMGPKLPEIFEEIRKNIGNENPNFDKNYKRYENTYVNILSYQNNMISIKMKEQKDFEKQIKEIYKPKSNFEGAFFDECGNNTGKMQIKSCILDINFLENEKDIKINDLNKYSNYYFPIEREQKFEKSHDYYYTDSYLEGDADSKDKRLYEKYVREIEKVKSKNNLFELCDPFLHKQEICAYSNFYDSLYKNSRKNLDNNNINSGKVKDLYFHYYKLINLNNDEQANKDELIKIYMPKKNWVHFNNYENNNSSNNIYDLRRKISFNNDLKKKNRFILFCKTKENNVKIKNIFNIKEFEEFNELMKQLKMYDIDFYKKEIINEDLHTNFQIETYDFSKYICEKLNISNVYGKNKDPKKTELKNDFFPKIPQFVFEAIFYS
ncbi:conserved Plasmodium protein, unknown function [Plasmodium relictum]|uniref:Uncharacterized protein n=1 Tax=Plasmodium relictum TaxID=85471 RepID=A0A1J1HA85_PLARL|nr:conserved Plasmodium protein, unknown function [Plasmodium relictum]CRH01728.1 conserved Plasmodium protein, unknown function [Plasmodium relictum]